MKRYDLEQGDYPNGGGGATMVENLNGDYVDAGDALALEKALTETTAILEDMRQMAVDAIAKADKVL